MSGRMLDNVFRLLGLVMIFTIIAFLLTPIVEGHEHGDEDRRQQEGDDREDHHQAEQPQHVVEHPTVHAFHLLATWWDMP